MAQKNIRKRFIRFVTALAVGGSAFQLSGCDPAVRSTLLAGVEATTQGLATTLITAFFITLDDGSGGSGLTTTP